MSTPRPLSPAAALGLLLLVAAVVWWPAVGCGFVWDDDDHVTRNPVLLSWAGLWRIWTEPTSLPQYYPLVHTSFWLEYRLWGLHPAGYHVVNVLLHTLAAWQVWALCRQLALRVALLAALWFLIHPVHVESVAWITERKNVLSLLCALLAARRWLKWYDDTRARDYSLGSLWFVLALLSKTVTATLPAGLLVVLWWRDGRLTHRAWRGAMPWLLLGALLGWFTAHLEVTHVGAAATGWQLAGAERLLVAGRAPWFYFGCLVAPFGLCFNYARWALDVHSIAQWAWPAATVASLVGALLLRRRFGRGPLAVLLLFFGMLTPALGFFDVFPFRYAFVADHFQYHASVPMLVGLAGLVAPAIARRLPFGAGVGLAAACIAVFVGISWHAQGAYADLETLWQRTLQQNERSTLALVNLGGLANLRQDYAAAKPFLERALAIDDSLFEAHGNLGVIAYHAGDRRTARERFDRALALKPGDQATNHNLAVMLLEDGKPREAVSRCERALATDPDYFEARITLAWALHDAGQWEAALAACDYVLRRLPDHLLTRQRAVRCLMRLGRHRQAASNAMVWLRAAPQSLPAKQALVDAMVQVLRVEPANTVRSLAENSLHQTGIEPAAVLPGIADGLRAIGAAAHADALLGR